MTKNVNKVQYKPNWNCHYESPLYNEKCILIKHLFEKMTKDFKRKTYIVHGSLVKNIYLQ
jgi:hypothetical protein